MSVGTPTAFAAQPETFPLTIGCDQSTSLLGATSLSLSVATATSGVPGGVQKAIFSQLVPALAHTVTYTPAITANAADDYSGIFGYSFLPPVSAHTLSITVTVFVFDSNGDEVAETTAVIVCGAEPQPATFPLTIGCDQSTSLLGATSLSLSVATATSGVPDGVQKTYFYQALPGEAHFLTQTPFFAISAATDYIGIFEYTYVNPITSPTKTITFTVFVFDSNDDPVGETNAVIVCGAEPPPNATATATATATETLIPDPTSTNTATATLIPDPTSTNTATATLIPDLTSTLEPTSTATAGPVVNANDFAISLTVAQGSASGSFADHTTSSGPVTYGPVSTPQFGTVTFDPATGAFAYAFNSPIASSFTASAIIQNDSFTYSASVGDATDTGIVSVAIDDGTTPGASPVAPTVVTVPPVVSLPSTGSGSTNQFATYIILLGAVGLIAIAGSLTMRQRQHR